MENNLPILVQKYGGSSLATSKQISAIAKRISVKYQEGNKVVVIVSAMGKTTDELIELANSITKDPSPRELDLLLSTGELISCTLMAMAIKSLGFNAISLSGAQAGIQTDTRHGKAKISGINPDRIKNELDKNNIVIIAGFQGVTDEMDTTTLGRGGSDTTAVAIAASLKAKQCEIYTDVDGIYTADPRIIPKAKKLTEIGFNEMLEMASYGAKMNPRSIEMGLAYNIPILVASSFNNKPGTIIKKEEEINMDIHEYRNRVSGITTEKDVAKITLLKIPDKPGITAKVFQPISEANINVDVIVKNTSVNNKTDLTFTVKKSDLNPAINIMEKVVKEFKGSNIISKTNLAKISIIGTGMQDSPGYATKMFNSLATNNINIDMITTSEIRITCIIEELHLKIAAQSLHSEFNLDNNI